MADGINAIEPVKTKKAPQISYTRDNDKLSFKKLLFGDHNFVSPNIPIGDILGGRVTAAGIDK